MAEKNAAKSHSRPADTAAGDDHSGASSPECTVDSLIHRACSVIDAAAMHQDLVEFAKRTKLSGTPDELESFRYLERRMKDLGYRTELVLHDAYISLPGTAHLDIASLAPECITHSFSQSSTGLESEIVDMGAGTPEDYARKDVTGKIVLLDGIASPVAAARASVAGAAGQIHVSPHAYRHEMCVSPVWGNPGPETLGQLPKTVIVSVNSEDGRSIRAALGAGQARTALIRTEVDTGWRKTPLLTAELYPEGAQPDCPFVMFSGHHDTWYYGVMDNGSANATMLAVAGALKSEIKHWRRGLRFCFWSGHSHGRYSGSAWYADTHFRDLEARCIAHVNVDSTGGVGATVLSDTPASAELRDLAREAVQVQARQEITGERMMRVGDQSFWGIGIPSIFTGMSEQPAEKTGQAATYAAGHTDRKGAGFGWWWHTEYDTIDKIDMEALLRDTRVYCHAVARLLCTQYLPVNYKVWLDEFARTLESLETAVTSDLDFSAVHERIVSLKSRLSTALPDRTVMAVSRGLVPLDLTAGDRFSHDAALPAESFQILNPLRRLVQAGSDPDQIRFASVMARQSLNRVTAMLDSALTAINSHGKADQ